MWRLSFQCRQKGVDVCALWESPKISILEIVAYIPTRDLIIIYIIHNSMTALLTCTRRSYVLSSVRPVEIVTSVCIVSDAYISSSR